MTNIKQPPTKSHSKLGHYQVGLSKVKEDVISAHFMDKLIQACENVNFSKLNSTNALTVSMTQVESELLPLLLKASDEFVKSRVNAAKRRARKYHARYNLSSPDKVGLAECIVELMYDRQFLKGKKSNYCYKTLLYQVKQRVNRQQAVQMILPALPFKSPSVLKCFGSQPDLCEIHFLLSLYEITKAIDCLYREYKNSANVMASFLVICDGNRFNKICHVSGKEVDAYQKKVQFWIDKLNIQDYVKLTDYTSSIENRLPKEAYQQKIKQREDNITLYKTVMLPLFDPSQIQQSICHAISADPFPEGSHPDGRFIPLFRSLIHTINYPCLLEFTNHNWNVYKQLYCYLIPHIYQPIGNGQLKKLLLENIKPLKQVLPSPFMH